MVQEHDSHDAVELNDGLVREGEDCVAACLVGKYAMADGVIGEGNENIVEESKTDVDDDGEENVLRKILKC